MNPTDDDADILGVVGPLSTLTVGMTDIIDDTFGTQDASDAEILALLALIRVGSISTTELRQHSGLSRRAHDRLVRELLDAQLVEHAPAPHDRRLRLLTLTRRGRIRSAKLEGRVGDYFTSCGKVISDITAIVGEPVDAPAAETHRGLVTALDLVDRMSTLGNILDEAIRAEKPPKHPKNRDQLTLLLLATDHLARPSRIADALTLSPGGMTKVLDRLESDRLIARSHGQVPEDRRAVVVDLTPDGYEVVAAIAAGLTSIKPELQTLFAAMAEYAAITAASTAVEITATSAARTDTDTRPA